MMKLYYTRIKLSSQKFQVTRSYRNMLVGDHNLTDCGTARAFMSVGMILSAVAIRRWDLYGSSIALIIHSFDRSLFSHLILPGATPRKSFRNKCFTIRAIIQTKWYKNTTTHRGHGVFKKETSFTWSRRIHGRFLSSNTRRKPVIERKTSAMHVSPLWG